MDVKRKFPGVQSSCGAAGFLLKLYFIESL